MNSVSDALTGNDENADDRPRWGASIDRGVAVIAKHLKNLPNAPGVYRMVGPKGDALYVGKAKSLRKRVTSYTNIAALSNRLQRMVAATASVEVITTKSAAEGGAYGAAMLAAVGTGHWQSIDEAAEICAADNRWTPDAGRHAAYSQLFEIYRTLYGSLTEANNRLSAFVTDGS